MNVELQMRFYRDTKAEFQRRHEACSDSLDRTSTIEFVGGLMVCELCRSHVKVCMWVDQFRAKASGAPTAYLRGGSK